MKRLLHTPLALLVWRIALLYAVLMLCRAAFWVYNAALLGPPVWSELGQLVAGSLKFDTVSVVYADGVFILLSLLPLHLRERRWYRGMLFWYYVIVNAVLIAAANLAVTAQLPGSGAVVANGSTILLYAGKEPSGDKETMPDLTNLSYETARDRMAALGLYIKTNSSITDTASQKISGQAVAAGTELKHGTVVEVTLVTTDSGMLGRY